MDWNAWEKLYDRKNAVRRLRPLAIFTQGGNFSAYDIPETVACQQMGFVKADLLPSFLQHCKKRHHILNGEIIDRRTVYSWDLEFLNWMFNGTLPWKNASVEPVVATAVVSDVGDEAPISEVADEMAHDPAAIEWDATRKRMGEQAQLKSMLIDEQHAVEERRSMVIEWQTSMGLEIERLRAVLREHEQKMNDWKLESDALSEAGELLKREAVDVMSAYEDVAQQAKEAEERYVKVQKVKKVLDGFSKDELQMFYQLMGEMLDMNDQV